MDRRITSGIIVFLFLAAIVSIFFIKEAAPQLVEEFGILIYLAPLVFVIVLIVILIFASSAVSKIQIPQRPKQVDVKKSNEMSLERQKVTNALKEAEKQYLKHKIDKDTYDSICQEQNQKLIGIESDIDSLKATDLPKEDLKKAKSVSADKKKIIMKLMEQKQKKTHELKIAEKSYLKRKIDQNSFQRITSDIKKEIISIEGQITAIQNSDEIAKLKGSLKEGAKEIARQEKLSTERKQEEHLDEVEDDLMNQLNSEIEKD
jgi:hypothetical protein